MGKGESEWEIWRRKIKKGRYVDDDDGKFVYFKVMRRSLWRPQCFPKIGCNYKNREGVSKESDPVLKCHLITSSSFVD